MGEITALFWDVGGVLLTNGWDRASRRQACEKFQLDWEPFEDRHELIAAAFDKGQLGLDEYLEQTVFYRSQPFTQKEFKDFMLAQSRCYAETLATLDAHFPDLDDSSRAHIRGGNAIHLFAF